MELNNEIPSSFDTECSVIAELVSNEGYLPMMLSSLTSEMFYNEECRKIYELVSKMYEARESVDPITIAQRVDKDFYIHNILTRDGFASELTIQSHCSILRSLMQRRTLYSSCLKGLQLACSPLATDDELLALPTRMSEDMQRGASKNSLVSIQEVINEVGEDISKGISKRVPSGFHNIDRLTYGGFGEGALVVLAARPSVGKTAFMLQMARESARRGFPSLVLSLEMTNAELAQRLIYSTHYVNAWEVASGNIDWTRFERAANEFTTSQMYLDETPQTLDEVCSSVTLANQRGRCAIAYIDYLQLMSAPESRNSLYQQVTESTKRLKKLAKKLKIPVVLLCQLNRNSVAEKRAPQLHDLRDSGSIEQDADMVIMLERLADENGTLTNRVNMYVRKNRGGLAGDITIEVESDSSYTNFTELQ